jgi:hypothetical protein
MPLAPKTAQANICLVFKQTTLSLVVMDYYSKNRPDFYCVFDVLRQVQ